MISVSALLSHMKNPVFVETRGYQQIMKIPRMNEDWHLQIIGTKKIDLS